MSINSIAFRLTIITFVALWASTALAQVRRSLNLSKAEALRTADKQGRVGRSTIYEKKVPAVRKKRGSPDQNLSSQKIPLDPSVKMGKLKNGITYYIKKNTEPENRAELRLTDLPS